MQAYRQIVGDTPATMLLDAYRARLEGDPQEARAILMRLLVQAPEHVRAHTQIAQIDLDAGHLQSAREHALTAARLNPNDPAARNLARALRRLHHPVLRAWFGLCLAVWQPGRRYLRVGIWAVFAIIGFVSVEAMVACVLTYVILRFAGAITLEWLQKTLNGQDAAVVLSQKY